MAAPASRSCSQKPSVSYRRPRRVAVSHGERERVAALAARFEHQAAQQLGADPLPAGLGDDRDGQLRDALVPRSRRSARRGSRAGTRPRPGGARRGSRPPEPRRPGASRTRAAAWPAPPAPGLRRAAGAERRGSSRPPRRAWRAGRAGRPAFPDAPARACAAPCRTRRARRPGPTRRPPAPGAVRGGGNPPSRRRGWRAGCSTMAAS